MRRTIKESIFSDFAMRARERGREERQEQKAQREDYQFLKKVGHAVAKSREPKAYRGPRLQLSKGKPGRNPGRYF